MIERNRQVRNIWCMARIFLVYITTRDEAEAEKIGEALVLEHLAACANVIPKIKSIYNWNGSLQRDTESLLLLKVKESKLDELIKRAKELHSYELPCIVSYLSGPSNPDYVEWVLNS